MTISDRATRLTAKVAPYREAILEARALGLTWLDLCAVLGIEPAPDRLRNAVRLSIRYKAAQIQLPESTPEPEPTPEQKNAAPSLPQESAGSAKQQPLSTIKRISL